MLRAFEQFFDSLRGRPLHDPASLQGGLMAPSYGTPLYFLAFDHRSSFERGLFGATPPVSPEVRDGIVKAKQIIFNANQQAVRSGAPSDQAGVLVDEEFGSAVARQAIEAGVPLAMPAERSGRDEFELQYGDHFAEHIEAFDPTFVKVLVRFNPEGDPDLNRRQTERLARLSEWLHSTERTFLFELLVPATTAQLDSFEDHQQDYDRQLRPRLVVEAIASLQAGGVEPDIWKVEGLDSKGDASAVVRQARSGNRDQVSCIVLGRGADWDSVVRWLEVGASVPGFAGFAVGRTLWHDPLVDHLAGRSSDTDTTKLIADRYLKLIDIYEAAGKGQSNAAH
jgi:myo-inositol catabolism protein IolC